MQHPVQADVLIDIGPMHSLTTPNNTEVPAFRRCRIEETPRPIQRDADRTPVGQRGGDRVVRGLDGFYQGTSLSRYAAFASTASRLNDMGKYSWSAQLSTRLL